jgi:type IV secretory pathway VirB6-like protein
MSLSGGSKDVPRARVAKAVWLLYVAIVVAGVTVLFFESQRPHGTPGSNPDAALAFAILAAMFVARRIWHGNNWARIVFACWFILWVAFWAVSLISLPHPQISTTVYVGYGSAAVQLVTQSIAAWLLFTTPGRLWFVHSRAEL